MSFIFCQTCLHVDSMLKKMKQNSCVNSYVYTFVLYLCFMQISNSMRGRATALHTSKVERGNHVYVIWHTLDKRSLFVVITCLIV